MTTREMMMGAPSFSGSLLRLEGEAVLGMEQCKCGHIVLLVQSPEPDDWDDSYEPVRKVHQDGGCR